jgi:hypothetical protein
MRGALASLSRCMRTSIIPMTVGIAGVPAANEFDAERRSKRPEISFDRSPYRRLKDWVENAATIPLFVLNQKQLQTVNY